MHFHRLRIQLLASLISYTMATSYPHNTEIWVAVDLTSLRLSSAASTRSAESWFLRSVLFTTSFTRARVTSLCSSSPQNNRCVRDGRHKVFSCARKRKTSSSHDGGETTIPCCFLINPATKKTLPFLLTAK